MSQTTTLVLFDAIRADPVKRPGTYQWDLTDVIGAGTRRRKLSLKYFNCWFTWYVFKNEVLTYNDGVAKTITLNGTYNIVTLPAQLQTLLGAGYTVTIDQNTLLINIVSPGLVTWTIESVPWSVRAKYFLGTGEVDIGPTLNATFAFAIKLGGDQLIQLASSKLVGTNNNQSQQTGLEDNALKIPVPVNGFQFIEYTPTNFYDIDTSINNNSSTLIITFLDQFGG